MSVIPRRPASATAASAINRGLPPSADSACRRTTRNPVDLVRPVDLELDPLPFDTGGH